MTFNEKTSRIGSCTTLVFVCDPIHYEAYGETVRLN